MILIDLLLGFQLSHEPLLYFFVHLVEVDCFLDSLRLDLLHLSLVVFDIVFVLYFLFWILSFYFGSVVTGRFVSFRDVGLLFQRAQLGRLRYY